MRRSGFTLVELLIVIVIIAILASLLLVGTGAVLRRAKEQDTSLLLFNLEAALATYRQDWGDYPPSSLDRLGTKAPNGINNGIEALVASLSSMKGGQPRFQPPFNEAYTNVDGDAVDRNVTGWFFGNNELRELRDSFGNTLIYLHHRDYTAPGPRITRVVLRDGADPVTIGVKIDDTTRSPRGPGRYQLWSVGADGIPGTADDLFEGP